MDGFSASELVDGLKKLATNKHNSNIIMKKNVMVSLIKLLKHGSEIEKVAAARLVWVLAFNETNKKEIITANHEVIEILQNLKKDKNLELSRVSSGALWVLEYDSTKIATKFQNPESRFKKKKKNLKLNQEKKSKTLSMPNSTIDIKLVETNHSSEEAEEENDDELNKNDHNDTITNKKHIMISYQWHYQKLMLRIKDSLEEQGFHVWMDVVEMGGSTLQKMAFAVEQAAVVLVGLSQRYKDSVSCRTEAEYAYKLNKSVIPLLLEKDYQPDGWLGAIVGAKFYFDFTNNLLYKNKFKALEKELGTRGKLKNNINLNDTSIVEIDKGLNNSEVDIVDWSFEDVKIWILDKNLKSLKIKELDGQGLLFLKTLKFEAPEFFYRFLSEQMCLKTLKDLQIFTQALEKLN